MLAAIFLDIWKVFYTVDREKLLNFMQSLSANYLTKSTIETHVNGMINRKAEITKGVPQGSVLGPLLYFLYVNNLYSRASKGSCKVYVMYEWHCYFLHSSYTKTDGKIYK